MKLREEAEERYGVAGEDKEGMQEPQNAISLALPNAGAHAMRMHCHVHSSFAVALEPCRMSSK